MQSLNNKIKDQLLPIDEIKHNILCYYNLKNSDIFVIKFKDTDKQRAVYKIKNNSKFYCLKKVYYDECNLLYVYSAMEWCFNNNIMVPKLLPTIDGNRYVKYKNMLFILTPWLEGEKCNFDNLNHILLSTKTLGKLHRVSKNFSPIEGSINRIGLENLNTSITKHFNQILNNINNANKYNDRFSKIFLNNLDINLELAKISYEISSSININNLSKSLCHGDFVNKNIIVHNDTISLIDFDKCKFDYCAKDISYLLRRLLRRSTSNWDLDITLDSIKSYTKENELTKDDFKYIVSYLAFPQKFWKISRDYYTNITKCNKNLFISLFEKSIDKSEYQLDFIYDIIYSLNKLYDIEI